MSGKPRPRLSASPLLAHCPLELLETTGVRGRPGFPKWATKTLSRARQTGSITVLAADAIAVKVLHLHPAEVWGDEWRQAWREV